MFGKTRLQSRLKWVSSDAGGYSGPEDYIDARLSCYDVLEKAGWHINLHGNVGRDDEVEAFLLGAQVFQFDSRATIRKLSRWTRNGKNWDVDYPEVDASKTRPKPAMEGTGADRTP